MRDFSLAQMAQQLWHARQRRDFRSQLLKMTCMAFAQLLDIDLADAAVLFCRDCLNHQCAAHPNATVNCPGGASYSVLRESLLPRQGMQVDRVNERAIQVKDEGFHSARWRLLCE